MTKNLINRHLILAFSAAALLVAGCSKNDRDRDSTSGRIENVYNSSTAAVGEAWSNVKDYTFDQSAEFKRRSEAVASDLDARIAELRASYQGQKASAARQAAMDRLNNARSTLSQKLDALGNASAATWDSAKAEVISATKDLEAAYDDAMADMMND